MSLIKLSCFYKFTFLISILIINSFLVSAASLPTVGGDSGTWGTKLNAYLLIEHGSGGQHANVTATGLNVSGDVFLSTTSLGSCTGKLITSADGNITCGTDATSGATDLSNYALTNATQNTFQSGMKIDNTTAVTNAYLNISDGLTPKFILDAVGRIALGLTTPTSLLTIWGGNVNFSNAGSSGFFFDTANSFLGIGIPNPSVALDILGMLNVSSNVTIWGNLTVKDNVVIEGDLNITRGVNFSQFKGCTSLETDGNGNLVCGSDAGELGDLRNYATQNESNNYTGIQNFSDGIRLGNTSITDNGTIRWNGADFQGYNGTQWVSLTDRVEGSISPAFGVHKNSVDQNILFYGWFKVNFTTEDFDTHNDYDTNNEWFKPSVPGKYLLTATVKVSIPDQEDRMWVAIYKNGVRLAEDNMDFEYLIPAFEYWTITRIVEADGVNDYFEIYLKHNDGIGKYIEGDKWDTYFSGSRIDGGNGLWSQINGSDIIYPAGNAELVGNMTVHNLNTTTLTVNETDIIASSNFTINANSLMKLQSNTTAISCDVNENGSIMYGSDSKLYCCNGSTWNALF